MLVRRLLRQFHRPPEALLQAMRETVEPHRNPRLLARAVGVSEKTLARVTAGMAVRHSTLEKCKQYLERRRERRVPLAFTRLASDDELHQTVAEMQEWLRERGVGMSVVGGS